MKRRLLFATVCLLAMSAVFAQAPALTGEMKKIDFLVGEWKGHGSQLRRDGSPENSFTQKTKVQIKDGLLRVKDERTYKPIRSTSSNNNIFLPGTLVVGSSSLDASLYYDDNLKLYRWRGENPYGRKNPLEAKLIADKTLQYGIPFSVPFEPSEGNRLTTIQITAAGEWQERLEIWHLGRWFLVEESTLKKIK